MQTASVLSISSRFFQPTASSVGKLASLLLLTGSLVGVAPQAHANDLNTVLGAGVGAVAGAAIGQHVGGRNGAIVGAGAGGLIGASIANQRYAHQGGYPVQQAYVRTSYPAATYYQQPVVWQAPQPQYRYAQPVNYYRQPVVVVQAPARHHHDRGHHHGHRHHDRGHGDGHNGHRH
ncbi:MAG: YMGG-like glycine zipper-containing protein [Pseudomonadota bacterium]